MMVILIVKLIIYVDIVHVPIVNWYLISSHFVI
jgi:hypothetical protein